MYDLLLLFLAVIPGIYLLQRVYALDVIEKEPKKLLIKIFLLGALAIIPAIFLEILFEEVFLETFSDNGLIYLAIDNFICIAFVEEVLKFFVMKFPTWKSPEFDYRFDAIVYGVTATLGFAVAENILYVFSDDSGFMVALLRAVLAVPGHAVYGIFMGYFYAKMKMNDIAGNNKGVYKNCLRALFIPIILHGWDDFCLSVGEEVFLVFYFVYLFILYLVAFRFDKKISLEDAPIDSNINNKTK